MLRLNLFRDEDGEPRIWTHGINESAKKKPGSFPWKARWWVHFKRACFGIEWVMGRRRSAMFLLHVGENDTSTVSLWLGIPFLLSLYLTLEAPWLRRIVPTVRRKSSMRPDDEWDMPITRSIGVRIFGGRIWIDLWADPNDSGHNRRWQQLNLDLKNLFLGRAKYSKYQSETQDVLIVMPEGRYPATITTYIAQWKRPRWPFPQQIRRAEIEINGGIPIPGKGDNSWDCEDNAIFSSTMPANSPHEAAQKLFDSVMRERIRYAAADWVPDGGWPSHVVQGD